MMNCVVRSRFCVKFILIFCDAYVLNFITNQSFSSQHAMVNVDVFGFVKDNFFTKLALPKAIYFVTQEDLISHKNISSSVF